MATPATGRRARRRHRRRDVPRGARVSGAKIGPSGWGIARLRCATSSALVEIEAGTLLEATLIGSSAAGRGIWRTSSSQTSAFPHAHVHAGVRLRRLPQAGDSVVQRYQRVPVAVVESEDHAGRCSQRCACPVIDGLEVETAAPRLARGAHVIAAELPAGGRRLPVGSICASASRSSPCAGVATSSSSRSCSTACARRSTSTAARSSTRSRGGSLSSSAATRSACASSRRRHAARCSARTTRFWLRGEGVQVSPAGDRIHAAEVAFVTGAVAQIEVELREIAAA